MKKATLMTPLGLTIIEGDLNGVARISVSGEGDWKSTLAESFNISENTSREEDLNSSETPEELQEAVLQLREYFYGTRARFSFKIAPEGTEFQKNVWQRLLKIPYGKTISYLALARDLGNEKAIRAVASANARNPLWIVVPCHRVIGTDGSLTGYAGGMWRKKWLLEHENPPKQTSLF